MVLLNQAVKLLPLLSMALAVDTTGEAALRLRKVLEKQEEKKLFVKKDILGRGRELSNYDELLHIFKTANSDNPGQITDFVQQKLQLNFAPKPPSESGDERVDSSGAVISTGFGSEFFCDTPTDEGIVAQYPGRDLCLYLGGDPYEDYDTLLGCYCTDSTFASAIGGEPSVDCECVMMFLFGPDDSLICRSVSIVPTATNDGSFQLQFDCSNVFELFPDDHFEPCAGRDQNGNCFDIDSVPNPSDEPVITGSFADLACLPDPLNIALPPPFGGRFQCNSPFSPPPGFPYPRTDSFVALLCDDPIASDSCDCFVSVTFPPTLDTACNECLIIPTGGKLTTYNISFDCSNFYDVGDCVGVDAGGNCISAAGDGQGSSGDGQGSSAPATPTNPPTAPSFTPPPARPPTGPPVIPPTGPPVIPPTGPPVNPPTSPPVNPPTSPPVNPPTSPPVIPPTSPPFRPPTGPPVGQDIMELVTGTWSGLTSGCVVETDDGPVDLDETAVFAWICPDGFVSGFSLHGRDATTGDPLLSLAFAGFSVDVDTVNEIVFYDVSLTNVETNEPAGVLPFDVVYLAPSADGEFGENLLAYMGTGTECQVLLFPDPGLEDIADLDDVCQT